jgi:hypothetical protein
MHAYSHRLQIYSPSLLVVHRAMSVPCIRAAQLAVSRSLSDQQAPGAAPNQAASFRPLNAVHTRAFQAPDTCQVTLLDANMLRQLSASHHIMSNAPIVSLPLPMDANVRNDGVGDRDANTLSQDEIAAFLANDLHVPAALQNQAAQCYHDEVPAQLIADSFTGQQRPAMTSEACAPHGVLAGYAKCATSTLQ